MPRSAVPVQSPYRSCQPRCRQARSWAAVNGVPVPRRSTSAITAAQKQLATDQAQLAGDQAGLAAAQQAGLDARTTLESSTQTTLTADSTARLNSLLGL